MNLERKEASMLVASSLSITLVGISKSVFTPNVTANKRERQPFTCLLCGRIKRSVGKTITINCIEGRTETIFVCASCVEKGMHHETV